MEEIVNAKLENISIFIEDHNILTMFFDFKWDGCGQGYGGYELDYYSEKHMKRVGTPVLTDCLLELFKVFNVRSFKDLCNVQYMRIKRSDRMIVAIGHITENRWFSFKEFIDNWFGLNDVNLVKF